MFTCSCTSSVCHIRQQNTRSCVALPSTYMLAYGYDHFAHNVLLNYMDRRLVHVKL